MKNSATEGQSDYWATLKCLRRIFKDEDNDSIIQNFEIPPLVYSECKNSFPIKKETDLCIRLAMASHGLTKISAVVRRTSSPQFETPDSAVVSQNYDKHPLPQCRLDSFFQGALCPQSFKKNVSQQNDLLGTCHPRSGDQSGLRPLCWYHP